MSKWKGRERAPVLMLSNSLGTTLHMWDGQVAPLTGTSASCDYDRRGHGQSGVPAGPYTMERLGRDVLAVLDARASRKPAGAASRWAAWSASGWARMLLPAVDRLVLTNTSSYFPDKSAWNDRLRLVREKGIAAFAAANMERWFTKGLSRTCPGSGCARAGDVRRHAARRLSGLRSGGPRHGPSRAPAQDHCAHPRHCRQSMTRRRLRRQTSTSASMSQGRGSRSSTPLTSRTSSSRRPTPRRVLEFLLAGKR